jgi:hypothetical protein
MKRFLLLAIVFVRCACPCDDAAPVARATASQPVAAAPAPAPRVMSSLPMAVSRTQRNPFAYVMPRPVAVEQTLVSAVEQPRVELTGVPALQAAPAAPQFPYRYIGRFGPAHDPIAAFAGDGVIKTVRPGERIDERFRLRTIGLETVQIEAGGWPDPIAVGLSSTL